MALGLCPSDADAGVVISEDCFRASGQPDRKNQWLGVRGRPGVLAGAYQFEVHLPQACLVRVGWAAHGSSRTIGDAIAAIGGRILLGLDAEQVEERFGEAIGEGAELVAGSLAELTQWPFEVVLHEAQRLLAAAGPPLLRAATHPAKDAADPVAVLDEARQFIAAGDAMHVQARPRNTSTDVLGLGTEGAALEGLEVISACVPGRMRS
eukprot:CAMPEP_0175728696 /NCGR_PEP_ID=MMETSP0097-20121207/49429_1 /TAXON_ID=311494 /ORGANISM="Alexandrium monilatum, Strain CCMP3105" /LENGTH=207 /DNA_ID=CAMNT_0017036551 /DNA_START=32 /DNA_END=653 /DNA_ORIENTATION=-